MTLGTALLIAAAIAAIGLGFMAAGWDAD